MAACVDKTVTGRIRGRTRRFRVPHGTAGSRARRSPSGSITRPLLRSQDARSTPTDPPNRRGLSSYMFIRAGAAIAVSNVPPLSLRLPSPPAAMQRAEFPVIPRSRFFAFSSSFFLSFSFLRSALLPPPARTLSFSRYVADRRAPARAAARTSSLISKCLPWRASSPW